MATSIDPQPRQRYVDFDEYVDYQLQKTRANIKSTDVLTALAGVATLVLGYVLTFVVLDHWVVPGGFGRTTRLVMLGAVCVTGFLWVGWRVVWPYLRRVNALYAARVIESADPNLQSNLINLVDLRRSNRPVDDGVLQAIEKRAAVSLSRMDVEQAVDRRPLLRLTYALLVLVLFACLYTLFSPKKISSSVWRALFPTAPIAVATRTEILEVNPGDVEVLARTQLEVTADLRGDIPERVTLYYTTRDGRFVDEPVDLRQIEGVHQYRGLITGENGRGILQNMTYHVRAGDARSRDYRITVLQPPSARVDQVTYDYPDYMQLPSRTQLGGHVDAWEGATITISATANMPVKSAVIHFSDTEDTSVKAEEVPMRITDGIHLEAQWKAAIRPDGTFPRFYRIQCRNAKGETDPAPTLYNVKVRPDQPPEVVLFDPNRDIEMPANGIVPMVIQARDPDFRLGSIRLNLEKDGQPLPQSPLIYEGGTQTFRGTYEFALAPFHFKPGDVVTYWIEARDNKQPLFNRRNTGRLRIRIVAPATEEEVQEQLEADKQRQEERLEAAESKQNNDGGGTETPPQEPAAGEPQEGGEGEQSQPEPKAGQQKGEQTESGESGQKQEQEGSGPSGDQNPGQQGQPGTKQDPAQDDEALRQLYEHYQNDQQQGESRPPESPEAQNQGGKGEQPDGQKPDGQEPQSPNNERHPNGAERPGETAADQQPMSPKDSASPEQPAPKPGQEQPGANREKNAEGSQGMPENQPDGQPADDGPMGDQSQPGDAKEKPTGKETNKDQQAKPADQPLNGEERPADESADAERRKATGDEQGPATPDHDPKADPTPAKNDLKRPDGQDPATRPSDQQQAPDKQSGERPEGRPTDNANRAEPNPGQEQQPNADQRPASSQQDDNTERPATERKGQPKAEKDSRTPSGKPQDQQTKPPQGGEGGETQQNDQGNPGGQDSGTGDSNPQPGNDQATEKNAGGKSGNQQDGGSKADDPGQPGGETKNSNAEPSQERTDPQDSSDNQQQPNQQGAGKSDQAGRQGGKKSSGKDSSSKPGETPGGQAGSGQGSSGSQPNGGASSGNQSGEAGEGSGAAGTHPKAEETNLEYSRQAANLVLKRLKDELERGEVDPELLEKLGWTEQDVKKFAERLQRNLNDDGSDQSPEALARRRQFEENLKGLELRTRNVMRRGSGAGKPAGTGFGPIRAPAPPEYQEAYDAYTRTLSKRTNANQE